MEGTYKDNTLRRLEHERSRKTLYEEFRRFDGRTERVTRSTRMWQNTTAKQIRERTTQQQMAPAIYTTDVYCWRYSAEITEY